MAAIAKNSISENPSAGKVPFLISLAFFLTGAACLLLEVVWARSLTLVFGGTVASVSTVIAAFMAGLGVGSALFGKMADRIERPDRLFIALALGTGLVAPLIHFALPLARVFYGMALAGDPAGGIGASLVRFVSSFVLLFIPAAFMGGTLPALCRTLAPVTDKHPVGDKNKSQGINERIVGRLYAINTLGGAFGCFAASMVLIGSIGLTRTVWIASLLELVAAWVSWMVFRKRVVQGRLDTNETVGEDREVNRKRNAEEKRKNKKGKKDSKPSKSAPSSVDETMAAGLSTNLRNLVLTLALFTGFASLAYEVLWTRVLMVYLRNSPHTFALILSMYLIGIAVGSALYSAFFTKSEKPLRLFGWIQVLLGVLALCLTPAFGMLPDLLIQLRGFADLPIQRMLYPALLLSGAVVLAPAILMGISLPILIGVVVSEGRRIGRSVGTLYLTNTIGAIAGSLAAGFFLIPLLGTLSGNAVVVILTGLAALLAMRAGGQGKAKAKMGTWLCAGLMLAGLAIAVYPDWMRKVLPPSFGRNPRTVDRVIFHDESMEGSVTVIEDERTGIKSAYINNSRVCGSAYDAIKTVHMLGALPVICHEDPKEALIIGLGLGITTSVISSWDDIQVDCVEICPAVTGVLPFYRDLNHDVLSRPNVNFMSGDGRNFVTFSPKKYDIISCDPTHPALGSGTLYSLEHYQACRDKLKPGGLTVQYLPLHKMAREDFRTTLATFTEVFPECALFMGVTHGVMLGARDALVFNLTAMRRNLAGCGQIGDLRMSTLHDPAQILGCYLAGNDTLIDFARNDPAKDETVSNETSSNNTKETRLNTDDLPLLDYSGSRGMVRDTWVENMSDLLALEPEMPVLGSDSMASQDRAQIDLTLRVKRLLIEGQWYSKQGNRTKEMEAFRKAASLNPRDPEVMQIFGNAPRGAR